MAATKYKVHDDECIEFKRKALARRAIAAALKEGKVKKPPCCDLCTLEHKKLEAHHVDYGSPLKVYWLCKTCHGVVHKKNHPLNPNNNIQTSMPTAWRRDENQVVSFALPFENFVVIKKLADEQQISVPKLLRGLILREFPVDDDQINFDSEARRTNDNTQNDQVQRTQNLDKNQDAMLQQERQKLQELRGSRCQDVSGMESLFSEIFRGHGT
ncbi:MAG: hypothetical protein ACRDFB_00995 [Rhabdochlamydiaceae bacterium]